MTQEFWSSRRSHAPAVRPVPLRRRRGGGRALAARILAPPDPERLVMLVRERSAQ